MNKNIVSRFRVKQILNIVEIVTLDIQKTKKSNKLKNKYITLKFPFGKQIKILMFQKEKGNPMKKYKNSLSLMNWDVRFKLT